MKRPMLLVALIYGASLFSTAQVGINTDNSQPDPSAGLDVRFTDRGFLPPRMTQVQRDAIASPAEGLIVICTDCGTVNPAALSIFIGGRWMLLSGLCKAPATPVTGTHIATSASITWNWNPVEGATGYRWGTVNNASQATDLGTELSHTETGLTCATPYTRFAWAYNDCGYSVPVTLTQSTQACWSCGVNFDDPRDGKSYPTVQIGTQCWFAANLNIGTRIAGSTDQSDNEVFEKYCYDNLESWCDIYGGLYQWPEAMQYSITGGARGICPDGWHLPADADWTTLTDFLGGLTIAGGKMKESGTAHWALPNSGATNSSGFTALPGGGRYSGGFSYYLTYDAHLWSSTQYDGVNAWHRHLQNDQELVARNYVTKYNGLSCRCIKD